MNARYSTALSADPANRCHQLRNTEFPWTSGTLCVCPRRPQQCRQELEQDQVVVALREGALRLSPHCYDTADEMEKAAAIVSEYS